MTDPRITRSDAKRLGSSDLLLAAGRYALRRTEMTGITGSTHGEMPVMRPPTKPNRISIRAVGRPSGPDRQGSNLPKPDSLPYRPTLCVRSRASPRRRTFGNTTVEHLVSFSCCIPREVHRPGTMSMRTTKGANSTPLAITESDGLTLRQVREHEPANHRDMMIAAAVTTGARCAGRTTAASRVAVHERLAQCPTRPLIVPCEPNSTPTRITRELAPERSCTPNTSRTQPPGRRPTIARRRRERQRKPRRGDNLNYQRSTPLS